MEKKNEHHDGPGARPQAGSLDYIRQSYGAMLPPHSVDIEQLLLGIMLNNDQNNSVVDVLPHLKADDFYRGPHQLIYEIIETLALVHNEPITCITVTEYANDQGLLDGIGSRAYAMDLMMHGGVKEQVPWCIKHLKNYSQLRQIIYSLNEHLDLAYLPGNNNIHDLGLGDSAQKVLEHLTTDILRIGNEGLKKDELARIGEDAHKVVEKAREARRSGNRMQGVSTGLQRLDNILLGWCPGDLVIIGARPSMGKTAFMLNTFAHLAIKQGKPALMMSMEMGRQQLTQRMISTHANVNLQKVRTGDLSDTDMRRLEDSEGVLNTAPLYIDDTAYAGPGKVRQAVNNIMLETNGQLGLLGIDYIQLMDSDVKNNDQNRVQDLTYISRALKGIGRDYNIPVIALAQLNRGVEHRQDKRPMLMDLRDCGAIEQDADIVAFLYRDNYYNQESSAYDAEFIIAKHRNGPLGNITLDWRGEIGQFGDKF